MLKKDGEGKGGAGGKKSELCLATPDITCSLEKDIGERDHGLPELCYNMDRTQSRHRRTSQA